MSTWKIYKGEDKIFEGVVQYATIGGATLSNFDLTNGTLIWHMGSVLAPPIYTRPSAGGTNWSLGSTSGSWTFSLSQTDTESLSATSYYFDIWLKTSGAKEYCLQVGTFVVKEVVGTIA